MLKSFKYFGTHRICHFQSDPKADLMHSTLVGGKY
jgi:hypothetical protein